jgi:uracil-DNA glycosylase
MESLGTFLETERGRGKTVLPAPDQYFAALKATPFERVKAVILGQDPYHGYGQANGLSFSVRKQIALPPSLRNIFKEMAVDLGQPDFQFVDGDLSGLAKQGVLLLNTVLSVEENKPGSHQDCGWENLTDRIIMLLDEHRTGLVFILWGNQARKKAKAIDDHKHRIITSAHPSPLSAYRGFFGSRPFSQCNQYLQSRGMEPVPWLDGF